VITVTVRFDATATREPAGLTMVMLKPELFWIASRRSGSCTDPRHGPSCPAFKDRVIFP
jgi:hypothetical protein